MWQGPGCGVLPCDGLRAAVALVSLKPMASTSVLIKVFVGGPVDPGRSFLEVPCEEPDSILSLWTSIGTGAGF